MEEMTASEILRRNADDNWSAGVAGIAMALDVEEYDGRVFELLANKIDAELDEVKKKAAHATEKPLSEVMAFYTGLYAKGAEPIGDWLERWFIPRPRFEDGEPVQDADLEEIGSLTTCYVYTDGSWVFNLDPYGDERNQKAWCKQCGDRYDRVKCPAIEVLLGDGNPVSKGETVYVIESGIGRIVSAFGTKLCKGMDGWDGSPWVMFGNGSWMHARDLTHERPVLGADGKLIVAGETVYRLSDGERLEVLLPHGSTPETRDLVDCCGELELPSNLAHTPPDTQERIDADARKDQFEYWQCRERECDECPAEIEGMSPKKRYGCNDCCSAMMLDLLRRQRELDKRTGGAE